MTAEFDKWFESLRSMYDEGVGGQLILFEESLEKCSKAQNPELRRIPEGQKLRNLLRSM